MGLESGSVEVERRMYIAKRCVFVLYNEAARRKARCFWSRVGGITLFYKRQGWGQTGEAYTPDMPRQKEQSKKGLRLLWRDIPATTKLSIK